MSPLDFAYRNCTDYAAWEINEELDVTKAPYRFTWSNIESDGHGDAADWEQGAIQNYGANSVDEIPTAGSIAWWGKEAAHGLGHVAIVASVSNDGSIIVIDEYNALVRGGYDSQSLTYNPNGRKASANGTTWPDAFIHILTNATAANHVLRVSATGTAYLADSNGVPHWIPDALTYLCDVAKYPLWNGLVQSQVDALGNGKPWATRCQRPQDAANHVLRVSATGTAYLADSNGVPHWIPDALTYLCYLARYPLFGALAQSQVDALGNGKPWATRCQRPQDAANHILIVSATNTSYYADSNGVPHWIPNIFTLDCLVAKEIPVYRGIAQSQIDALGNGKPWATCDPGASAASQIETHSIQGPISRASHARVTRRALASDIGLLLPLSATGCPRLKMISSAVLASQYGASDSGIQPY
jgi:surface antigen